ncbi:malonyl-ACP O-methyltransferase BioC [Marinisporobacter balticus]|uniref:Malonyl-[acyl-carrier protein] O-methyltransferase n=1 Tax=Marinisporobacter balticus TaxID=2018667 RepID=A0A4R2KIP7_9FIRM|nr:malonyl-ACP O-methyltransferase BioC [Marinisporobacter balticus]TCO72267.1 malonyl-CoA O-methyltransferase [Marinisporobacter balticus]
MINKEKLKRRFSRNAKQYDQYAKVQKIMGDTLIAHIKNTGIDFENILEVGCGTGYVTRALKKHFKGAKITAVDIAPGMIEQVKATMNCEEIEFICGDIEEMILDEKYDLIISNATFQWFNQLDHTLTKLIKLLDEEGILCFSTFGKNTFCELHQSFDKTKDLLKIKEDISAGQSFYSLEELQEICKHVVTKNHFKKMEMDALEKYEYEYFNGCKDFLYSVKKIGANNSQNNRNKINPDFIEKVIAIYDRDYLENDQVRATYNNLFVYMQCKNMDETMTNF